MTSPAHHVPRPAQAPAGTALGEAVAVTPVTAVGRTLRLTHAFQLLLRAGLSLLPMVAILHLQLFQVPALHFKQHGVHELAIAVSTLLSSFVTYVTWQCYRSSGEVFLRWLVLGLAGFTLLYAPHGVFTRWGDHHMGQFVIYGPLSRLAMAACFYAAVTRFGVPPDAPADRVQARFWVLGAGACVAVGMAMGIVAVRAPGAVPPLRLAMETLALGGCVLAIARLGLRRSRSPLMLAYLFSLAMFAQSSVSFLLGAAWTHQWWLAHGIFAAGFFALSYGIVQAFHTTRSFASAYSQEEMVERLRIEKQRADQAVVELEQANEQLRQLATTDALTGAANRRQYSERVADELARLQRRPSPLALLALDLDHFKAINDRYGHHVGDEVLKAVVAAAGSQLRAGDLLARTGGEEFRVILPDTPLAGASAVAERIRARIASAMLTTGAVRTPVTVSIGCAAFDGDIASTERTADQNLYRAKALGRNRVVADADAHVPRPA